MADDIDIEEHDVLDNPRLKNIFPDITNIKTEVIDFDEVTEIDGQLNNYENPVFQAIKIESYESEMDLNINQFESHENNQCNYISNIEKNVIILGTKPSTPQPSTPQASESGSIAGDWGIADIRPCSVVLEDWGTNLSNNPCYCSECQTLFPTQNALDFHSMTLHSFLVAVNKNKALKSTAKGNLNNYTNREKSEIDLLCQHCNEYFPDANALIKHKYSLIPNTFQAGDAAFSNKVAISHHNIGIDNKKIFLSCPICTCYFKNENVYKAHIQKNHNTSVKSKVRTTYNPKCKFCNSNIIHVKNYNSHIHYCHMKYYFMELDLPKQDVFQCNICHLNFMSAQTLHVHKVNRHQEDTKKLFATTSSKPMTSVKSEEATRKRTLVPKSVIFKCNKCQIHFISCSVAIEHSRHCTLSKGEWKCESCPRMFKLSDRQTHILQHGLNERIRALMIKDDIQLKILNRCLKCNVCFDEDTFTKHHGGGCKPSQTVECDTCHLSINEFAITNHLKYHKELNYTLNDFIITDYCEVDHVTSIESAKSAAASTSKHTTPKYVKNTKSYSIFLYYCPNCHLYTKRNRAVQDGHASGTCQARTLLANGELCKLCGLLFSRKSMLSHKRYHRMFQLKLTNFSFLNMLSGTEMNPPFPKFQTCQKCRVHFYSGVALKNHICDPTEHRTCKYCRERFSDLALKLHVPFHEYSNPRIAVAEKPILDLMKKYESLVTIWNILFLCQVCRTVLDSYNDVVEHCQNHFCNMESYNVDISYCDKCDLRLIGTCFRRHEKLHIDNNIDINAFEVITYNYTTLLTDEWLNIFNRLSNEKIQQILSKSIYNDIRSVRMKLIADGSPSRTMYKCASCSCCIEVLSVMEHLKNADCGSFVYEHNCIICNIKFINKSKMEQHDRLHQINDEPFRIILFNEDTDKFLNDALLDHTPPADLKFIRCNQCGKLISKHLYRRHVYKHNYVLKTKMENMRQIRPKYVGAKVEKTIKKVFNFYKCRDCEVCVSKLSISKHQCSVDNHKKLCPKCNLHFRYSIYTKHLQCHRQFPKLNKNTINVIYIKDNEIENKSIKPNVKPRQIALTQNKTIFYQCLQCQNYLISEKNARRHLCGRRAVIECPLCGIRVHGAHLWKHQRMHRMKQFNRNNIVIIKFKGNKIFKPKEVDEMFMEQYLDDVSSETNQNAHQTQTHGHAVDIKRKPQAAFARKKIAYARVHKCTACDLYFVTRDKLLEHIKNGCGSGKGIYCKNCELKFHPSSIRLHDLAHKCSEKSISLIMVTTLKINDSSFAFQWVFCCERCNLYWLNSSSLRHHYISNHTAYKETVSCQICNITFAKNCYNQHIELHHKKKDFHFSKLNIEHVVSLERSPHNAQVEQYPADDSQNSCDDSNVDATTDGNPNGMKSCKIFRCPPCNLYFTKRNYARLHQRKGHVHGKTTKCSKCKLKVITKSFAKHLALHALYNKFTVVNCHPKRKSEANFRTDSYTFLDLSGNTKAVSATRISGTANSIETFSADPGTSSRAQPVSTQLEMVSLNRVRSVSTEPVSSTTTIQTATGTKLYKCSECDVYFLTAESCYEHTSSHSPLDPTEYIACKICDFQFLCESLGRHMKGHREMTFKIDELIVDEYQIDGSDVNIETYSAVDRMKSKLVSTTTHSDDD